VGNRNGEIVALDAEDGSVVWTVETGSTSPVDASPAVRDDVVYIGAGNGIMYALDASTGNEIWATDLEDGRIYASASVTETSVYVFGLEGTLHALNIADGAIQWTVELGNPAYSSATVVGDVVYALSEEGGLMFGLDANTGEELWRYQTGREGDWRSGHPVFVDGILYITSNTEGLLALSSP
ncbi:MAG: PQQ-binding-like beta-propeller repeat protein, partial [Chloroflexota bacterium]